MDQVYDETAGGDPGVAWGLARNCNISKRTKRRNRNQWTL